MNKHRETSTHVNMTFNFDKPEDLRTFLLDNKSKFETVESLTVHIMSPLNHCELTELEKNGHEKGPNLTPLVQAWREAFRQIPKNHQLHQIIFDMSCEQEIQIRELSRLVQLISTVVSMKAKNGHVVSCVTVGLDDERKKWLEGSIVGSEKDTKLGAAIDENGIAPGMSSLRLED